MAEVSIQQAAELATEMLRKGNAAVAKQLCLQILSVVPNHAMALHLLAVMAMDAGEWTASENYFRQGLAATPSDAEMHNNLGVLLVKAGRAEEGIHHLRTAVRLNPEYADAFGNLAGAVGEQGFLSESVALNERAVAIKPTANSLNNLGNALMRRGKIRESIETLRKAIELAPDHPNTRSNFLLISNYDVTMSAKERFDEHVRWGKRLAGLVPPMVEHANTREPKRRLRIGYLSADFRMHSVSFFVLSFLQRHDRKQVEVFCYSISSREDEMTRRVRAVADQWRAVTALPDERVAEIILTDQIDILVDLATYTSNNRMPIFARKPAPIQVGYLGYPHTSGLGAIDYRITDSLADPRGESEALNVERLVRIDPCAWCYQPPPQTPPVAGPPVERKGFITFGSFNALSKVNAGLIETWAKILHKVPQSRLAVKAGAFADRPTKERIIEQFAAHGIAADRLQLRGHFMEAREHLAAYAYVDIALDTFPYNGTTTTCEALWMGVPVVGLAGSAHAGRVGVSLLTSAGLEEWIAPDVDGYIELAAKMARGKAKLKKLRSGMRKRLSASVLMDGTAMARRLEAAYRVMWEEWCSRQAPGVDSL